MSEFSESYHLRTSDTNAAIIQANEGLLLHFVSAEDHGWSFSLFNAAEEKCRFACQW
jgi:hypothetical protein